VWPAEGVRVSPALLALLLVGAGASGVEADYTMVIELGDGQFTIQESWNLRNRSGAAIDPKEIAIPLPDGGRRARLDVAAGFKTGEDLHEIVAAEPLPAGEKQVVFTYALDAKDADVAIHRRMPFLMAGGRVIMDQAQGMTLSSSLDPARRTREMNGVHFSIFDFPAAIAGADVNFELHGVPHKLAWPRQLATAVVFAILAWMALALLRPATSEPREKDVEATPLSAEARRERLIRALEVLEKDHQEKKVSDKTYARRRASLVKELAVVLKEIELRQRSTAA
jgi:hypothetical protein